jgi:hypothetical protein
MKKIIILIFVLALNSAPLAFAQTNAARARVEAMFNSFQPGQIEMAIDAFAKDSLVPPSLVDQVASQAKNVLTPERTILGFEFVQEQNAGESVKRLTYVLKLNDRPLFWNFSFYRPTNEWVPLRLYFSEEP